MLLLFRSRAITCDYGDVGDSLTCSASAPGKLSIFHRLKKTRVAQRPSAVDALSVNPRIKAHVLSPDPIALFTSEHTILSRAATPSSLSHLPRRGEGSAPPLLRGSHFDISGSENSCGIAALGCALTLSRSRDYVSGLTAECFCFSDHVRLRAITAFTAISLFSDHGDDVRCRRCRAMPPIPKC